MNEELRTSALGVSPVVIAVGLNAVEIAPSPKIGAMLIYPLIFPYIYIKNLMHKKLRNFVHYITKY